MFKNNEGISFVKFSATWCAPCKVLSGVVDKIIPEFSSDINFIDVDIDDNPDMAKSYKIRSVPTIIIFKDGEEVVKLVGSQSLDVLKKTIRDILDEKAA